MILDIRKFAVAAFLGLPLAAAAQSYTHAAHNYTYLEGGFVSVDRGRNDDSGFRIAGSVAVTAPLALFGEYVDTGDFSQLSAGGLFHMPMNRDLDLNLGASLEHVDGGSQDDTGLGLRAGLRWRVIDPRFELNPEVRHVDVFDDGSTSLRFAGLARVAQQLDLQAAVQGGDDDRFELGVRYNFVNYVPRR